jgi:hypothetical protein
MEWNVFVLQHKVFQVVESLEVNEVAVSSFNYQELTRKNYFFERTVEIKVNKFVEIVCNHFRHKIPKNSFAHFANMYRSSQQVFLVVHVCWTALYVEFKLGHQIAEIVSVVESNVDQCVTRIEGLNVMGEIGEAFIRVVYDAIDGDSQFLEVSYPDSISSQASSILQYLQQKISPLKPARTLNVLVIYFSFRL